MDPVVVVVAVLVPGMGRGGVPGVLPSSGGAGVGPTCTVL